MALPDRAAFLSLDWYWRGQPFARVPASQSIQLLSLDWYWKGQPFVSPLVAGPQINADCSEALNATDSCSEIATLAASGSEAGAAADSPSATWSTSASALEAGAIAAAQDGDRRANAAEVEALAAADSSIASSSFFGLIDEAGNAIDVYTVQLVRFPVRVGISFRSTVPPVPPAPPDFSKVRVTENFEP